MKSKIAALLSAILCSSCGSIILEAKDIGGLEAAYYTEDGRGRLRVCGLCEHSALSVSGITFSQDGGSMLVKIKASPMAKGSGSGSFDFSLPIPDDVDRVLLGGGKSQIWRREIFELDSGGLKISARTKSVQERNSGEILVRAKISVENASGVAQTFNLKGLKARVRNQPLDESQRVYVDSPASVIILDREIPAGGRCVQDAYWVLKARPWQVGAQDISYEYAPPLP